MKNNKRKMKNILLPALIVLLMTGCRKDLCYNHDEHGTDIRADVKATWECEWERSDDFDWEIHWPDCSCGYDELRPEVANGIRAVIYDTEGTAYTERNLKSEGGILPMTEGMHSILFYNNDTEYIVFEDLPSSATATATTRTRTRSTFANTEAHDGERTVNEPDMLSDTTSKSTTHSGQPNRPPFPSRCTHWFIPTWCATNSVMGWNT